MLGPCHVPSPLCADASRTSPCVRLSFSPYVAAAPPCVTLCSPPPRAKALSYVRWVTPPSLRESRTKLSSGFHGLRVEGQEALCIAFFVGVYLCPGAGSWPPSFVARVPRRLRLPCSCLSRPLSPRPLVRLPLPSHPVHPPARHTLPPEGGW